LPLSNLGVIFIGAFNININHDMTSCLTKLTICVKMRSIGKSWTRDYQDHVISWTRVHDLNGMQQK